MVRDRMRRTRGSASASSRRPSDTVVISSAHCGRGCCTCCLDRRDSDAPMRRSPSPVGDRRRTAAGNRRSCPDAAAAGLGCPCRREATVLLAAFLSWAFQLGQRCRLRWAEKLTYRAKPNVSSQIEPNLLWWIRCKMGNFLG